MKSRNDSSSIRKRETSDNIHLETSTKTETLRRRINTVLIGGPKPPNLWNTRNRGIPQSLVVLPDAECWPLKPKDAESLRN